MGESRYLIGVDVGTGSVRAGLFTESGELVQHCKKGVEIWSGSGFSEQSTADIWDAVCYTVRVGGIIIKHTNYCIPHIYHSHMHKSSLACYILQCFSAWTALL